MFEKIRDIKNLLNHDVLCQKYLDNPYLMSISDKIFQDMERRIFPIKGESYGLMNIGEKEQLLYIVLAPLKYSIDSGMEGVKCIVFSKNSEKEVASRCCFNEVYTGAGGYASVMDSEYNKQNAIIDAFTERFMHNFQNCKNPYLQDAQMYKKRVKVNNVKAIEVKGLSYCFADHLWHIEKLLGNVIMIKISNPNYVVPEPLKRL